MHTGKFRTPPDTPKPRFMRVPILLAIATAALPHVASAQGTRGACRNSSNDFNGIDQFWHLQSTLSGGIEPAKADWDSLFTTPGYAALEQREHRRAAITVAMRAAFLPRQRHARDSLVAANGWVARAIRHMESLPARSAQLDAFATRLCDQDVLGRAIERARTLLPSATDARFGRPNVAFTFFLPDGRGYPTLIVADLANVMGKEDPVQFFAHEVTHYYWAQLGQAREGTSDARGTGPDALSGLLMKIAEESAGDQFDKAAAAELDSNAIAHRYADAEWRAYLEQYRRTLSEAPSQLRQLDEALSQIAAHPDDMQRISDSLGKALPMEGRTLGMYMARAIRRQLGDGAFAAIAGDAVAYMRAYEQAARKPECACAPLSDAAMRAVALLRLSSR